MFNLFNLKLLKSYLALAKQSAVPCVLKFRFLASPQLSEPTRQRFKLALLRAWGLLLWLAFLLQQILVMFAALAVITYICLFSWRHHFCFRNLRVTHRWFSYCTLARNKQRKSLADFPPPSILFWSTTVAKLYAHLRMQHTLSNVRVLFITSKLIVLSEIIYEMKLDIHHRGALLNSICAMCQSILYLFDKDFGSALYWKSLLISSSQTLCKVQFQKRTQHSIPETIHCVWSREVSDNCFSKLEHFLPTTSSIAFTPKHLRISVLSRHHYQSVVQSLRRRLHSELEHRPPSPHTFQSRTTQAFLACLA